MKQIVYLGYNSITSTTVFILCFLFFRFHISTWGLINQTHGHYILPVSTVGKHIHIISKEYTKQCASSCINMFYSGYCLDL